MPHRHLNHMQIGYNYQRNADDLFKAEFKLAEDVLKRGRVLRTPHQIVDSIRAVKAASVIPKATKVPFSSFNSDLLIKTLILSIKIF